MISAITFNQIVATKYADHSKPSLFVLPLDIIRLIFQNKELKYSHALLRAVCRTFRGIVPISKIPANETFFLHIPLGAIKVIQYMEKDIPDTWKKKMGSNAVESAARNNQFEILKFLINNGFSWWSDKTIITTPVRQDIRIAEKIARTGNLEMLQWALEKGCNWDIGVCVEALEHNHIELLEWSIANGVPNYSFFGLCLSYDSRKLKDEGLVWVMQKKEGQPSIT